MRQNKSEHRDTEAQSFYFIDLQINSLCVFVSLCSIHIHWKREILHKDKEIR